MVVVCDLMLIASPTIYLQLLLTRYVIYIDNYLFNLHLHSNGMLSVH